MFSLALVSLIAWILTILAPCVLPVLPVILAGSIGEKWKWYPYIVTGSLALSIVMFTILLKASTLLIDVPPEFWKYISGVILLALGLVYIFPHTWTKISSKIFGSRANTSLDRAQNIESSTLRWIVTGAVLGPVFSTCSPTYSLLLATVFPVSFLSGVFYTFLYAIGLSLVLLMISIFGNSLIKKLKIFADEWGLFRKVLGLILVVVWLLILTGIDKKIETYLITQFDVTSIEEGILDRFLPTNLPLENRVTSIENPLSSSISQWQKKNIPKLSIEKPTVAPEIPASLTNWINSNPLTMASLRGKVVLIDFWTYSCINCQRTLPYLIDWDKKYRDQWLVIIGVHAPEFAFEKVKNNVEQAVSSASIAYPVVLDNDFILWNLYNNRYWPAKYFIDREGNLRHTHFGEGEYAESEQVIQYLLTEWQSWSGLMLDSTRPPDVGINTPQIENMKPQSPETYLGTDRRANMVASDIPLASNQWTLSWRWYEQPQSIMSTKNSTLRYNFSARDVYLVLGGKWTIRVTVDGKVQNSGKDIQDGTGIIDADRMYHIVHGSQFMEDAILEIDFSPWVSAYAFTFGS